MVARAADLDRILFELAQGRGGLAGIQQDRVGALEDFDQLMGMSRNAAHALQVVERGALAGQQDADIRINHADQLALLAGIAVLVGGLKVRVRLQQLEHAGEHAQTAQDAVLLADQLRLAGGRNAHNCIGGNIFTGDIFTERLQDMLVHVKIQIQTILHKTLCPFA